MADRPSAPTEVSGIRVPRAALLGALGLISFTMTAIIVARDTGVGTVDAPPIPASESRDLVFRSGPGSGMAVFGVDARPLASLLVEGDSFVMAAVRALAAQRADDPVADGYRLRLIRGSGGGLALADPQTGRTLRLAGFGPDNEHAFAVWLDDAAVR